MRRVVLLRALISGYPARMAAIKGVAPPTASALAALIDAHESELRAMGVLSLALFGSVLHGDARPGSDVDLLVELERPAGLLKFARVENYLADILGCAVDLIPKSALRPQLRERVLLEAERVL
jgi:uncharacterized protein